MKVFKVFCNIDTHCSHQTVKQKRRTEIQLNYNSLENSVVVIIILTVLTESNNDSPNKYTSADYIS